MAESEAAVVVAAIIFASGLTLFDCDKIYQCSNYSALIFLTSVFSWISVKDIYLFPCRLPRYANFVYEVVASSFIFALAFKLFWVPLHRLVMYELRQLVNKYLMKGECIGYGILCHGDSLLYYLCLYIVAIWTLWIVLYGHGFFDKKTPEGQRPGRRRSSRFRRTADY